MEHLISFPGLGIGEFILDRVAFTVFGIDIYWYAVMITLGIGLAVGFGFWQGKSFGIKPDDLLDGIIIILPLAVIGARLFFVLFELENYKTFWDVINIRDGGLGIWGAIIVAFPAAVAFCKVKKINPLGVFDITAIGFFIGQTIGRWGNFFNAEVYGTYTNLPWGMTIDGSLPVHPLFFYESVINAIGLIIALVIWKRFKKRMTGDIFFFYISWYGLFRGLLELLRPSQYVLYVNIFGLELRTAVIIGFACFVVGIAMFFVMRAIAKKKAKLTPTQYENLFDDVKEENKEEKGE
ncbi:MAG: prolipoprotein diacylglyceryl transferase [Clostridia bacterium]|nr:prolipoprotein diacylglyceryl transferase [Clostridia bacterium]